MQRNLAHKFHPYNPTGATKTTVYSKCFKEGYYTLGKIW